MSAACSFFKAFIRPFAGDEKAVARARIEFAARPEQADPVMMEELAGRLDAVDKRRLPRTIAGFTALAALALPVAWVMEGHALIHGPGDLLGSMTSMCCTESNQLLPLQYLAMVDAKISGPSDAALARAAAAGARLSQRDADWLFGSAEERACAALEKWHASPQDPALYASFARLQMDTGKHGLPEDFSDIGGRIDPDNGWFALASAARIVQHATAYPSSGKKPATATIVDQAAFKKAGDLIHIAASKPFRRSYILANQRLRLDTLPRPVDGISQMLRFLAVTEDGEGVELLLARDIESFFLAESRRLADEHDAPGFTRLVGDWKIISGSLAEDWKTSWGNWFALRLIKAGETMRTAASDAGATEQVRQLDAILHSPPLMEIASYPPTDFEWLDRHASQLARFSAPHIASGGSPNDADYLPQRRLQQVMLVRIEVWQAVFVILVTCGVLSFRRWRISKEVRRVAARLPLLLDRRDWTWILAGGIVVPAGLFFLISRLTPLGCRDYSINSFAAHVFFSQAAATLMLGMVLVAELAQWRLARRVGSLLDHPGRFTIIQAILPILCLMHLISVGADRWISAPKMETSYLLCFALFMGAALRIGGQMSGTRATAFFRTAVLRIMIPVYLLMALLLTATIPLSIHAERYWVKRDPIFDPDPQYLGYGRLYQQEIDRVSRLLVEALETK